MENCGQLIVCLVECFFFQYLVGKIASKQDFQVGVFKKMHAKLKTQHS